MKTSSSPNVGITNRLLGLSLIALIALATLFGPNKASAATYTMAITQTNTTGSSKMVATAVISGGTFTITAGYCDTTGVAHADTGYQVYAYYANGNWVQLARNEFRNAACGVGFYNGSTTSTTYVGFQIRAISYAPGHTGESSFKIGTAQASVWDAAHVPNPDAWNDVRPPTGPGHVPDQIVMNSNRPSTPRKEVRLVATSSGRDRRISTTHI